MTPTATENSVEMTMEGEEIEGVNEERNEPTQARRLDCSAALSFEACWISTESYLNQRRGASNDMVNQVD
jgi:hypothetical protein